MKEQISTTTTTVDVECQFCDWRGTFAEGVTHRRKTQHLLRTVVVGNLRRQQNSAPAPQPVAEGEQWRRDGSTVYELMDDGRGGLTNRWSANVQGPRLTKDEAEAVAARILSDHAAAQAVPKLVEALKHALVCSGTPDDCDDCREAQQLCS